MGRGAAGLLRGGIAQLVDGLAPKDAGLRLSDLEQDTPRWRHYGGSLLRCCRGGPDAELVRVLEPIKALAEGVVTRASFPPRSGLPLEVVHTAEPRLAGYSSSRQVLYFYPDCLRRVFVHLDGGEEVELDGADAVELALLKISAALHHELLHARRSHRPMVESDLEVWQRFPGYEEGVVEALTRKLCPFRSRRFTNRCYDPYVRAWLALGEQLEVPVERMLAEMDEAYAEGCDQRVAFVAMVAALHLGGEGEFTQRQVRALAAAADRCFAKERADERPDFQGELSGVKRLWAEALRPR